MEKEDSTMQIFHMLTAKADTPAKRIGLLLLGCSAVLWGSSAVLWLIYGEHYRSDGSYLGYYDFWDFDEWHGKIGGLSVALLISGALLFAGIIQRIAAWIKTGA